MISRKASRRYGDEWLLLSAKLQMDPLLTASRHLASSLWVTSRLCMARSLVLSGLLMDLTCSGVCPEMWVEWVGHSLMDSIR